MECEYRDTRVFLLTVERILKSAITSIDRQTAPLNENDGSVVFSASVSEEEKERRGGQR